MRLYFPVSVLILAETEREAGKTEGWAELWENPDVGPSPAELTRLQKFKGSEVGRDLVSGFIYLAYSY